MKGNPSRKIVRKHQLSGAKKVKAYNKKAVMVLMEPADYAVIARAAELDYRKVSAFIRHFSLAAAVEKLELAGESEDSLRTAIATLEGSAADRPTTNGDIRKRSRDRATTSTRSAAKGGAS